MVSALRREWAGAAELEVAVDGTALRALAYPALTGRPQPGDRVLLNTTALALGLGTGGYALVVAVPGRLPEDPAGPGHRRCLPCLPPFIRNGRSVALPGAGRAPPT